MELPSLEGLTPGGIIAIRQGDAFEEWRSTLKLALERASGLSPSVFNRDNAARAVVKETLLPASQRLEEEFRKSSALTSARSASTTIISGILGGLAGYLFDPGIAALMGAAATGFRTSGV